MNNIQMKALANDIVQKNKDVIFVEVYTNGIVLITKPLVCHASNDQYRLIGQLKIEIYNVNYYDQIKITNLDGYPGIMHSSGQDIVSTDICFGNYNSIRYEIVKTSPNWMSIVNRIVLFCKSVNLNDERGRVKFNSFPVLSTKAAKKILTANRRSRHPITLSTKLLCTILIIASMLLMRHYIINWLWLTRDVLVELLFD
jgi:hypothetical protein